ncbi:hypothetical protein [Pelagibaculum spongiae]|uniref:Uncharacterized protein n=1 Tax=Pelagibaculum spongiae TaxID=2080658 RepID=A0A2V1H4Q1_9GAMM|nr:hypothetical protein [Pelagibaculum spongiae]PVZ70616.1 hypothetical protein DC094_08550 [Pelagibaculum spongiae]
MQFSELKLGDIVFMNGQGTNGASVIKAQTALQKVCLFGRDSWQTRAASPETYHCGIVCHVEKNKVELAHAASKGFARIEIAADTLGSETGLYEGSSFKVFRCQSCRGLADLSGIIARKWVPCNSQPRFWKGEEYYYGPAAYSARKAYRTFGRSSHYGSGAKQQAALYFQHQDGSVPALHNETGIKQMFCSMFVVAIWQAAAGPDASAQVMAKDARFTSPMALEGYLVQNNFWDELGGLDRSWLSS